MAEAWPERDQKSVGAAGLSPADVTRIQVCIFKGDTVVDFDIQGV